MEAVKLFLEHKQDINVVDNHGLSLLHMAASLESSDLVRFLVQETEIDCFLQAAEDNRFFYAHAGDTALEVAARKEFHDVVSIIESSLVTKGK